MADAADRSDLDRDADLAKILPCANKCGTMVRQFGSVPIGGSGTDLHFPGPWWCDSCIQARCVAASGGMVETVDVETQGSLL